MLAAGLCVFVTAEYKMESLLIFESCWRRFEERYGLVSGVNPDRCACHFLQCVHGGIICSTAAGCSEGATYSPCVGALHSTVATVVWKLCIHDVEISPMEVCDICLHC